MKAYTESERQALIADCKADIAELESAIAAYPWNTHLPSELMRQQIALASLQAEQVHQFIYNNPYEEGYTEWVDCNVDYFNGVPTDCRRMLYTAPPVPVMKPVKLGPKQQFDGDDWYWSEGVVRRIKDAGYPVEGE